MKRNEKLMDYEPSTNVQPLVIVVGVLSLILAIISLTRSSSYEYEYDYAKEKFVRVQKRRV